LLNLSGDRLTLGEAEPAGEARRVPRARKLQERERIAVALDEQLLEDGGVERTVDAVEEKRPRLGVRQAVEAQLRKPRKNLVADSGARGEDERDPLGVQTPCDETEDLLRGSVQPLRVVHDADERLMLRDLGEERQDGEPDEESIRRRSGAQAEDRRQRV